MPYEVKTVDIVIVVFIQIPRNIALLRFLFVFYLLILTISQISRNIVSIIIKHQSYRQAIFTCVLVCKQEASGANIFILLHNGMPTEKKSTHAL